MVSRKSTRGGDIRQGQRAVCLGAGLEKSLSAYASAAAAAGVSLLALVPSVQARIIYTPANTNIPINGGAVLLDLNHDGIGDFSFLNSRRVFSHNGASFLFAGAKGQSNEVWGRGVCFSSVGDLVCASARRAGLPVGPNRSYLQQGPRWIMGGASGSVYASGTNGQWLYTKHRYLGLKFMIGGQIHYGWARFNVILQKSGIQATLTGYAYETIPNKPIITGKTKGRGVVTLEPATLGRMAQGASGIQAWREKK